ncbi:hypothetical protein AAFC00_001994 [Neodothiora populina]|uniref:Ras GEF n=1 Tax=Neodothiora populina TaxID=2781224 RepID=A0ABR3PFX8_9PEZI
MPNRTRDIRRESIPALSGQRPVLKHIQSSPQISPTSTFQRPSSSSSARNFVVYEGSRRSRPQSPKTPTSLSPTSPTTPRARASSSRLSAAAHTYCQVVEPTESEPLPDINLVVLGAPGVGKSTFIRHSFGLSTPPTSPIVTKQVTIENGPCLVRLVELSIADVDIEDDGEVKWPNSVGDSRMPRVDGVLTLYDISDKASFQDVPETLNAIDKSFLPSVLVSCKCDTTHSERQVDPSDTEKRAKAVLRKLNTLQISTSNTDLQKQGVLLLIKTICSMNAASKSPAALRRRTLSSTGQLNVISRASTHPNHSRASSDYSVLNRDLPHARHDSTVGAETSNGPVKDGGMHRSFLNLDESQDSASYSEGLTSASEDDITGMEASQTLLDDRGTTFDTLVDRLLILPKTKADSRFRAIFLALYRKFAAPGQLLEAIVHRFEALESAEVAFMSRTISQLRYLSVIEQWIGTYPGDFAHPRTRRRMGTFVIKLSNTRIFSAAAREMSADLDVVANDDDTDWACCDKNRELQEGFDDGTTLHSRSSSMLDDTDFQFSDTMGNLSLDRARSPSETISGTPLPSSFGLLHTVDIARRQSISLSPVPKVPINKMHWRTLLDMPNDIIARELTRIDWIMFSSIRPRDLIRHVSLPASQKAACKSLVHVNRMIDHFNHLRDWVANFILLREKPKHRVLMLEKLMQVARRLRDLNNYNSLGAFLAGINSAPIHRLNATRELLPHGIQKDWMKLEILMSPTKSYSAYRLAWENSSGERIPFVPLPLRDLVGSQEGNRTFVGETDGRINWQMFEVMGEVIVGIQRAQGQPYHNLGLTPRQDELRALILNLSLTKDDDALYERSVQLEPSNSGDRRGIKEFFKRSNPLTN